MTEKELEDQLSELTKIIEDTCKAWFIQRRRTLTEDINRRLDKHQDEIIVKLLGFRPEYGRFEIDHCNGRSGQSVAGDFFAQTQKQAIDECPACGERGHEIRGGAFYCDNGSCRVAEFYKRVGQ